MTNRRILLYFLFIAVAAVSCKCKPKQKAAASVDKPAETQMVTRNETSIDPRTVGKVSHKYRATGCATVIIVNDGQEVLTLIPRGKLPADIDVDGQEVVFDYTTLKMPQPAGCSVGIPAEIKDVAKK
ncbi:MAG: hypothetical protein V4608_11725 [Bacteroidota bacterium]